MIHLQEQEIKERYQRLPRVLQDALNSPSRFGAIGEISEKYKLNEEDSMVLTTSVGMVLLGYIKPQNLFKEINEYLEADEKIVVEVIRDINRQVFVPLHKELEDLYGMKTHIEGELEKEQVEPVLKIKTEERKPEAEVKIPLEKLGESPPVSRPTGPATAPSDAAQGKPAAVPPPVPAAPVGEEVKPLIIHREEIQKPATEDKKFKGFDFPFGIFEKEGTKAMPSEPVKVRVETPGKRVVHYSEYRTPVTPFGKPEEEIITIKKEPPPTENKSPFTWPKPEPKPETPKPEQPKPPVVQEKKGPSIEGNIIDLKNL
ncbi:MAG: hypothetical protein HY378_01725 [Candidatus Brennerbacteria bacterium]|nr:hypothetical protein [Candidatus Brennerbacteria bacterium]